MLAAAPVAAEQGERPADLGAWLARVGDRVQQYYARAQSIVCVETVRVQRLRSNMMPDGHTRQLVYELRIAWDSPLESGTLPEAQVVRQLLTIDGRAPRAGEEPGCLDPKPVSSEPLSMLLPHQRDRYRFSLAGTSRIDGRQTAMLDYKEKPAGPAEVTRRGNCVSMSVPGRSTGRLWIDPATDDVVRLDEHLGLTEAHVPEGQARGGPDWIILERADTSIHYKPVVFSEPDETLRLPATIETLVEWRGAGSRYRLVQQYSGYKRFLTEGHVVEDPGAR